MKPVNGKESHLRSRYAHPHDVFYNGREGMRIAHKMWKRRRSKLLRKAELEREMDTGQ